MLIGTPVAMLSFFLVLKLSNNSTVDLLCVDMCGVMDFIMTW
jgi:hypothetical protein